MNRQIEGNRPAVNRFWGPQRLAVCWCTVLFTLVAVIAPRWAIGQQMPNIVLVLADDMGYGDVRALNAESQLATPYLDRLVGEGLTFTDAHSPSSVCTPTRYGLLTGRYCWRTRLKKGVLGGYSPPLIEPDRSTIGSMLKQHGYQTAAIGKWHLGMQLPTLQDKVDSTSWAGDPGIDFTGVIPDSPIHHGFDTYFGVSASLDMAPFVYVRDDRFHSQPTIQQPAVPFPHFVRKGPRAKDFVIDEVLDRLTAEAESWISKAAADGRPFFLYLPLTAPHKPTQPHERFRGKSQLGEYGDFVVQVDDTVGRVLAALDAVQVADETLFIYSSDNGSYMYLLNDESRKDHVSDSSQQAYHPHNHRPNGVFRGTKADIWEAGHHVPLIVRWPNVVRSGAKCDSTVCLTDWYATIAEIVGHRITATEAEDSCSLVSMLKGDYDAHRGVPVVHHSARGMFAIRAGKWKLVAGNGSGGREKPAGRPFQQPYQLFDMVEDVEETTNVIDQYSEVAAKLVKTLDTIRQANRSAPQPSDE